MLKKFIDAITLGSERPVRRLIAYYLFLAAVVVALIYFFPIANVLFSGERLEELSEGPELLQDGLRGAVVRTPELPPRLELAITTTLTMFGTLALMLPVSWVYMSIRRTRSFNQTIVQTLIILPVVVCGIILVVRNSLALAFSLAGVVSAIRFRTTLKEAGDLVFVLLAIGVGFAAGVQALTVGALTSVIFNFVVLAIWRYDFGRNALDPAASAQFAELTGLAEGQGDSKVPDRDLVVGLSPKNLEALSERFNRLRRVLGADGKKPRYNSVLSIGTNTVSDTQEAVQKVLDKTVKRWKLDEVVTNRGKPSELYYLMRLGKSTGKDEVLTAIRAESGTLITNADIEVGETATEDKKDTG